MRIGFDAPFPPARSGVADYAAALFAALGERTAVVRYPEPADRWLYHLGNNREHHAEIYARSLARPGYVVLHDAVLLHFHLSLAANAQEFADAFCANYGRWHQDYALRLWRERSQSGAGEEYYRWPMLAQVARSARAIIVHNQGAAARVLQHAAQARVEVIPHLLLPGAAGMQDAADWRARWGLSPDHIAFGIFGFLRASKRLLPALRAFSRLAAPHARLVVCGSFQDESLRRAAEPFFGPRIIVEDALPATEFAAAVAAVDVGINLRWPAAGETSGLTLRWMGAGRAVILTASPDTADFPEGVCLKLLPGPAEEDHLLALLEWLAADPARARRIGAMAREHAARYHDPAQVAARYLEVLTA